MSRIIERLKLHGPCVLTALVAALGSSLFLEAAPPEPTPYFVWDNQLHHYVESQQPGNPEVGYYEYDQSNTPANNPWNSNYIENLVNIDANYDVQDGIALGLSDGQLEVELLYDYDEETETYSSVQGVPVIPTRHLVSILESVFFDFSSVQGFDGMHEFTLHWVITYSVGHLFVLPNGAVESTVEDGYWDYAAFTLRIDLYNFIQWYYV